MPADPVPATVVHTLPGEARSHFWIRWLSLSEMIMWPDAWGTPSRRSKLNGGTCGGSINVCMHERTSHGNTERQRDRGTMESKAMHRKAMQTAQSKAMRCKVKQSNEMQSKNLLSEAFAA